MAAERRHIAGMEGLRALACLVVFGSNAHHMMGLDFAGRLWGLDVAYFLESSVGVLVLIVLSGALLSLPFWSRLDTGVPAISIPTYAARRAVRIVPAYYACLLAFVVLGGSAIPIPDLIAHALFVNNFRPASFYSISQQFWTIGMFVQFYVILPFVFLLLEVVGARGTRAVAFVVGLAFGAYALHCLVMTTLTDPGIVASHSTLAHLPIFLFGVIAGRFLLPYARPGTAGPPRREWLFWTALLAAGLLSSAPAADALQWPYGRYLFPWLTLCSAIFVVALPAAPVAARLFDVAPLRWLGTVSYGVYVYQMVCMTVVARILPVGAHLALAEKLQFSAASLLLTLAVSTGSYLVMERPLLRWVGRAGKRHLASGRMV